MARIRWLALFLLVVVVVSTAGAAWWWRDQVVLGWFWTQGSRALTEQELASVQRCEDPGWSGLLKVLEQDLALDCPGGWFAQSASSDLGGARAHWLDWVATHPGRPARQRLRAGLTLLAADRGAVPGLALLLADPEVPSAERQAVVTALVDGGLDDAWADPSLRDEVAWQRVRDGDLASVQRIAASLRLEAAMGPGPFADDRAELALEIVGVGGGRIDRLLDRKAAGLPPNEVPRSLVRILVNRGEACRDRASAGCLRLSADLLQAWIDGGQAPLTEQEVEGVPEEPVAADVVPIALWEVLYDGELGAVEAAAARFGEAGRWVAAAEGEERVGRLLGLVANPRHGFGVEAARAGRTGDPVHVLTYRRASPWTTALAALTLGELAGVPVSVFATGDGIVLGAGGRRVGVGPCGAVLPIPETLGDPWPQRAIIAQAATEAAGAALRRGEVGRAHRLAAFAERLDPVSASGVGSVVTGIAAIEPTEPRLVGRALGALVLPGASLTPSGAEAARRERGQALGGSRATGEGCPGAL